MRAGQWASAGKSLSQRKKIGVILQIADSRETKQCFLASEVQMPGTLFRTEVPACFRQWTDIT